MNFPPPHARSDSSDTSSTGSSYTHILDHVLTYGTSYEMPLRTMYTLNCAPRAQPLPPRRGTPSSSACTSPTSPMMGPGLQDPSATQVFNEHLMAQMSNLPSQPTSLPPSFITSFLGKCFPAELVCVDFPQALTGLDYLKDLESRRCREVGYAMSGLDIDRSDLGSSTDLRSRYPGVAQWLESIEEKERKIESLYTQLYVGLRRWILINELSLVPFNKHNCVAMLNTLYPPMVTTAPTSKLTTAALKQQRDGFFKYIQSVEKNGPKVLTKVMQQGMAYGDDNGWAPVTRALGMYLQLANSMISECTSIGDVDDVASQCALASFHGLSGKIDSGILLRPPEQRPVTLPTVAVSTTAPTSSTEPTRPKTPSGNRSTALEKLARGLKTIGRTKTDVTEIGSRDVMFDQSPPQKRKSLRKMRSMGNMGDRSRNGSSDTDAPPLETQEMRRQRVKKRNDRLRFTIMQSHEF